MKRSIALIVAGGLTAIVALVFSVSTISALVPSRQPVQNNPLPPAEIIESEQFSPPQAEPVDTAATAQILYQQVETSLQAQETSLRAEVTQRQQTITELDDTTQAQVTRLNAQIVELQAQIDQKAANIQAAQANMIALQQAIQDDDATYQNELAKMVNAENQLRQELETASGQLNVAYQQLTQRQAIAQQAAIQAAEAQRGGGGSSDGNHNEDREHDDDHGGHDDDHGDHEDDDD